MPVAHVVQRFDEILEAIQECFAHGRHVPGLILLYAGVDIAASLNRPSGKIEVTRGDFIAWVDRFMIPGSGLDCTAEEFYGARCAVLHTLGAESELSRGGKARQIFYAYGSAKPVRPQTQDGRNPVWVVVHIDELLRAWQQGVVKFLESVSADEALRKLFAERGRKIFKTFPPSVTEPPSAGRAGS